MGHLLKASRNLIILFGTPLIWLLQINLSLPLSSRACYPHAYPLSAPTWGGLSVTLIAITGACIAGGLACFFLAWKAWRRTNPARKDQEPGLPLTTYGILSSIVFMTAIIFTSCAIALVSPCSPIGV